jgi:hypothetical protein
VHEPSTLELIRIESAVTDPLVAAGPNAVTQSPTATSVEVAGCVALTVVEPDVVSFRVSVFGVVGCLLFELLEPFEPLEAKLPGDTSMPETVRVEPLTPVTLPEAMLKSASRLRMLLGRDLGAGPLGPFPPGKPPSPVRNRKPPPVPAPGFPNRAPPWVQDPVELAVVTVIERAAMVVFEFFDGVPVAVTQVPTVMELTASVTVLEN